MSAFIGIVHRTGQPAHSAEAAAMMDALACRASDAVRLWNSGAIALGHQAFHTTCESTSETQPYVEGRTRRAVVFDGRIDNRSEVVSECERARIARTGTGDAELALAAYERWGEDAPRHLVGDFAFAIWDEPTRTLFCARDAIGVRPLYCHLTDHRILIATDHRAIVASGLLRVAPNDAIVAEYLASDLRSTDETLYAGVTRVPPGHTLTIGPEGVRRRRYWDPAQLPEVAYGHDDEYADRFFELFRTAVECRTRSSRQILSAYLSGGLDSSAVLGMTQWLADRHPAATSTETFSMVFPDDAAADESGFIDAVVDKWQLPAHRHAAATQAAAEIRAHAARRHDVPDAPADLAAAPLRAAVAARGGRVVLTGMGGDHGFAGSLFHYAEHLRHGELRAVWRQLRADIEISDVGWSPANLLVHSVLPLLPRSFKNTVRPLARRLGWPGGAPRWIRPSFAERVGLEERLRYRTTPSTSAKGDVCESYVSAWTPWALEKVDRAAAEFGIEERHPFFDRRLVEFAVGIPESQRWTGTETKFVLRRAMRGLLPGPVAARRDKGEFSGVVVRAVNELAAAGVYDDMRSVERGWIDPAAIETMRGNMNRRYAEGDDRYGEQIFPLWLIGGIELWLQEAF